MKKNDWIIRFFKADKDATSNANHGTGVSMTASSDVTANIGLGQEFDGSADYISLGSPSTLDNLGSRTISAWM